MLRLQRKEAYIYDGNYINKNVEIILLIETYIGSLSLCGKYFLKIDLGGKIIPEFIQTGCWHRESPHSLPHKVKSLYVHIRFTNKLLSFTLEDS